MTPLRDIYGPGFTQAEYRRTLAAGHETGWWDDNGIPAPWPDNFDEADQNDTDQPQQDGDEPPF